MSALTQAVPLGKYLKRHKSEIKFAAFAAIFSLVVGIARPICASDLFQFPMAPRGGESQQLKDALAAVQAQKAYIAGLEDRVKELEAALAACKGQK